MLSSLITPWRLRRYSSAVLLGILLALLVVFFSGQGPEIISGRLGGDFPAFYAAGRIFSSGYISDLYNLNRQADYQKDLIPGSTGFLPFAYPPFVALIYAPLSFFSYRVAFCFILLFNLAALIISLISLRTIFKSLNGILLPVFTLSLTFYPFLVAILNGQNTALTFMLIALIWKFTTLNKNILAGIFMSLLLYKPQFAIPLIGIFAISGRLKVALTGIFSSISIIALSFFFTGVQPYLQWINFIKWFSKADAVVNGHNAISWIGFFDTILGTESKLSFIFGTFFCILTIFTIAVIWTVGGKKSDINSQIALSTVSLILIPPHVMFYDISLLVLTYTVIIQKINRRRIELILAIWIFGFTQIFSKLLGFSPLFSLVVFSYFLSLIILVVPATKKVTEQSNS